VPGHERPGAHGPNAIDYTLAERILLERLAGNLTDRGRPGDGPVARTRGQGEGEVHGFTASFRSAGTDGKPGRRMQFLTGCDFRRSRRRPGLGR
jgi:hypothetical protein